MTGDSAGSWNRGHLDSKVTYVIICPRNGTDSRRFSLGLSPGLETSSVLLANNGKNVAKSGDNFAMM